MLRRPLRSPLFPYTTLFRSLIGSRDVERAEVDLLDRMGVHRVADLEGVHARIEAMSKSIDGVYIHRSEEHTSELQSLRHLVCRLLLEKKKKRKENIREDVKK